MTSARKLRANRVNARASSGPKTAAGKAQSAQNAFRHGFNVPVVLDPTLASDVEALALRIVGKTTDLNLLELARQVAEAQIDLRRVRTHRHRLIEQAMADLKADAAEPSPFEPAATRVKDPSSDERIQIIDATVSLLVAKITKELAALDRSMRPAKLSWAKFAKELAVLDRYERRGLSRRKFAIREFDLARLEAERRAHDGGVAIFGGVANFDGGVGQPFQP